MKRLATVLVPVIFLTACELFGPSGSGTLSARVEATGAAVGGAVVEVRGPGVQGVRAEGSTRLFQRPLDEEGAFRLVLVNPAGAPPEFGIDVDDVDAELPSASVLSAADTDDRLLEPGTDVVVRVRR